MSIYILVIKKKNNFTCMTYFKSIHPHSERLLLLPRTSPPSHTHKVFVLSFMHPSTLCRLLLYPLAHNTMVNCLYACLSKWTASCFIHLCVPSTYQDQAYGWQIWNVHWIELNRKFPIHSINIALGLNTPNFHAQTCFAVLDGKSKLQVPCKFNSQRNLWGKGILKRSF